jgi:hypothetical protein
MIMPKRKSYKRRLHVPLFNVGKTTTEQGYRDYMRLYMRELRRTRKLVRGR